MNDVAFGKWRAKRLPFLSSRTILNFIQVYEKFGKNDYLRNNFGVECYTPTFLFLPAPRSHLRSVPVPRQPAPSRARKRGA